MPRNEEPERPVEPQQADMPSPARHLAQYDHADLGLNPEADQTEDLRSTKSDDPGAGTPRPSGNPLTSK